MNTSTPITDEWIQQAVLSELKWEGRVEPSEIGVSVADGIVTLTGLVDSYAKRVAAEEAAQRVHGVRAVANEVTVRLPQDDERSDADLAAAILHALHWDAAVPTEKLAISVANGWVTLKGEVPRPFQKFDAERVVRRLTGVKGLTNLIAVEACVTPTDLKERIEEALVRSAHTDAAQINVEVQGGRVVLTGTVRSWAEQHDAERAAWLTPGVEMVEDRLVVAIPGGQMREVLGDEAAEEATSRGAAE
ncbi:MAG TPA: BON domain-containing protein [Chloroflexota bacterium]|nr:BON domain-containing protein [Chloroflexota bacterium]